MVATVTPRWDDIEIHRKNGILDSASMYYNILGVQEGSVADLLLQDRSSYMILGVLSRRDTSVSRLSDNAFEGTVEYSRGDEEDEDDDGYSISFDTTGGTQHISQSYQTRGRYAISGYSAPDHAGAIGVSDGSIAGCDIIAPQLSFTMSKQIRGVGSGFLKMLTNLTGKVNSGTFQGFSSGEVLFEGASGSKQGKNAWDVTYKFRASPNVQSLSIGGIQVGPKNGWDYFWVQYIEQKDANANMTRKIPFAAYVEVVYGDADFSPLMY